MRWDVIVVGAGAAGAPLAARLSEDPERSVLLLEAGPVPETTHEFPKELLDAGTLRGAMPGHPHNWSFLGRLTPTFAYTISRGRILGGSTTINGAYFIRARIQDFERWSSAGNEAWSWQRVLPFYRAIENDLDYGDSAVHGASGPVTLARPDQSNPAAIAFAAAAAELGFAHEPDKNDQSPPGHGPVPMNVVDGVRLNTGITYLNPVRHRPNLTVRGGSVVRRVIFEDTKAIGVEIESNGSISQVMGREIVLSAGAVKSPHILLVSGIGARADLELLGIDVVSDRPGVGRNFSDHPEVSVGWQPRRGIVDYRSSQSIANCLNFSSTPTRKFEASTGREGDEPGYNEDGHEEDDLEGDLEILPLIKPTTYLLTGSASSLVGGVRTALRHPLRSADALRGVSIRRLATQFAHRNDLSMIVAVQAETSRGQITLESADPSIPPLIDYHYLSTVSDRRRLREAVRTAVALLKTRAFAPVFRRLTELDDRVLASDDLLDEWMRAHLGTAIHLCGSAKFGAVDDPTAVVNQYGEVHGVTGLRVADTSILPTTPTRGPAATAILIGERIADFMRTGEGRAPAGTPTPLS